MDRLHQALRFSTTSVHIDPRQHADSVESVQRRWSLEQHVAVLRSAEEAAESPG
jgi:hypothetical protein